MEDAFYLNIQSSVRNNSLVNMNRVNISRGEAKEKLTIIYVAARFWTKHKNFCRL